MAKDSLGFNYTSYEERELAKLEHDLAEERKAAGWKDELLKEFDTAAGTILEDAGCLHDDGLVCEICQPFVDARKKYADHINPSSPEVKL